MTLVATTFALLRHLRAERGMALVLVVVVAFTAFVMATIPRLLNRMLDDEILFRVESASDSWRNIAVSTSGRLHLTDDDDLVSALDRGGNNYRADLPPTIREIIDGQSVYAESPEYELWPMRGQSWVQSDFAPRVRGMRFRFQTGLDEQITFDSGRMPIERPPPSVRWSELAAIPGARGEPAYSRYEVALPSGAEEVLGLKVGDLASLRIPFWRTLVFVQVVGFYSVNDPTAVYWNNDTRLHEPRIVGFAEDFRESESVRGYGEASSTTAIAASAVYRDFLQRTEPDSSDSDPVSPAYFDFLQRTAGQSWKYAWTFYVDAASFDGGSFDRFARELEALKVTGGPVEHLEQLDVGPPGASEAQTPIQLPSQAQPQVRRSTFAVSGVDVRNELATVFGRVAAQARLISSAIALVTVGILAVALASIALLAALVADRRREMIRLLRGRGASRNQLLLAQLVEGMLLAVPSAAAGLVMATLFVDARPAAWSTRAAVLTGLLSIVLLLIAARVNILARLGALLASRNDRRRSATPRRYVAQAVIVLLALTGTMLLRQRGLHPSAEAQGMTSFDPFLAAVPVLLGFAVGIASLRLYPLLIRGIARLTLQLRGVVLFVGLRWIAGQSFAATLPLLVMLLGVGVATSTAIIASSVDRAQADSAWREVKADYRLDARQASGSPTLPVLDFTSVRGVERQAREFRTTKARLTQVENISEFDTSAVTVLAIEMDAYQQIAANTAVDPELPERFDVAQGAVSDAIPAIVSERWVEAASVDPELGTEILIELVAPQFNQRMIVTITVAAIRPTYPGIPERTPFIIVEWDVLAAVVAEMHPRPLRPTTIYLGARERLRSVIEDAVPIQVITPSLEAVGQTDVGGIELWSRSEFLRQLRGAPLARGLADISRLSVVLVAIYAGLALVIAIVLTARERSRILAYLATLGLSRRQAWLLAVVEIMPRVIVASALGVLLGVAIPILIEPGLDLRAFAGPGVPVRMAADPTSIVPLVLSLVLSMLLLVLLSSIYSQRFVSSLELRIGEE